MWGVASRALDAAAFSSVWVAGAAALCAASASHALGVAPRAEALVLAFGGTLCVYVVDRLRDHARDAGTAPLRTAFVTAHRRPLTALAALGGVVAAIAALAAGPRVASLSAGVLAVGLLHRRLKHVPFGKAFYIAAAWTAVVVGVPAILDPTARHVAAVAAIFYATLLANAIASSVRDAEAGPARIGLARGLRVARVLALGAVVGTLLGGPGLRLLPVAGLTLLALLAFRPGERFGLVVLDGALSLGAALSLHV